MAKTVFPIIIMGEKIVTSRLVYFPRVVIGLFFGVIFLGLMGTWLPAFGILPAIGKTTFSLQPWFDLINYPGFRRSVLTTLFSGWGAATLSVSVTLLIVVLAYDSYLWRLLEKTLAHVLSIPHSAFAIGFGFLIAPSGWLVRLISPLMGFQHAPDWIITKDPYGLSLMATLSLKEIPFLLLMTMAALSRLNLPSTFLVGRSLGYHPTQIWLKLILPRLYPQIRLAVFAVLAYSLSVVDVSMIIGPNVPSTLAVMIINWFNDPDIAMRLVGAAGATLLLVIVVTSVGMARAIELVAWRLSRPFLSNGIRRSPLTLARPLSGLMITVVLALTLATITVLIIWSITWQWRFPSALPTSWTTQFWLKGLNQTSWPILNTLSIGLASAILSLILVIGCLEYEVFLKYVGKKINWDRLNWITYLPLLIPQIAFMFGAQVTLTFFRLEGRWISLVWAHLLFVYPYVFLTLSATYREYDERMSQLAAILSGSKWKAFWKIKLPILTKPALFSFAVGFAVSVSQYIPTIFIGAGRYVTITTEAVNLSNGADRRVLAVYALIQQLLPLLVFLVAIFTPIILYSNKKGMRG